MSDFFSNNFKNGNKLTNILLSIVTMLTLGICFFLAIYINKIDTLFNMVNETKTEVRVVKETVDSHIKYTMPKN